MPPSIDDRHPQNPDGLTTPSRSLPGLFIMLEKMISGGETGANQAAWQAATAFGVPTGGWVPKGFLTEDGPRPRVRPAIWRGGAALGQRARSHRTERPGRRRDPLVWPDDDIGRSRDGRGVSHVWQTVYAGLPGRGVQPAHVAAWIIENTIKTLNVAGNREHEEPGIGEGWNGSSAKSCNSSGTSQSDCRAELMFQRFTPSDYATAGRI